MCKTQRVSWSTVSVVQALVGETCNRTKRRHIAVLRHIAPPYYSFWQKVERRWPKSMAKRNPNQLLLVDALLHQLQPLEELVQPT